MPKAMSSAGYKHYIIQKKNEQLNSAAVLSNNLTGNDYRNFVKIPYNRKGSKYCGQEFNFLLGSRIHCSIRN